MKDRVPANPNRRLITPEDGSPPFYATVERADNPIQEGTLLDKASLLPDSVESAIWGSAADRTVAQALQQLRALISTAQSTANSAQSTASSAASRVTAMTGQYTGAGGSNKTISLFYGWDICFFMYQNKVPANYGGTENAYYYSVAMRHAGKKVDISKSGSSGSSGNSMHISDAVCTSTSVNYYDTSDVTFYYVAVG